jgi:hypothetical protein
MGRGERAAYDVGEYRCARRRVEMSGIDRIAEQEWLDTLGERLQHRVNQMYERTEMGRRARSFLRGGWLGTPLHSALSDIPMGAWTVAAALDACEIASGFQGLALGADAALHVGLAGAVASAATGWADWSATEGRARRLGLAHALLEGSAVALFIGSSVMRGKDRRKVAQGLSFLGYACAATASWLGGRLVFSEQVGVKAD